MWLFKLVPSAGPAIMTYWGLEETGCSSCSGWSPWRAALPERRAQAPYRGRASWDWGVWFQQPSCRGLDRNLGAEGDGSEITVSSRPCEWSTGSNVFTLKPTFGFSQWSHVVLNDSSVTHKQLCLQWITQWSMNKTSGKQHAYLNKFQVRHSCRRSSGLTDDLKDIFAIRRVQKRTKLLSSYSFKPNRIFFSPGTTATHWLCLCAHIQCSMELFEMEMTPCLRYSLSGSAAPAEDLELTITPRGVWCSCTCECALWSLANQQKTKKKKKTPKNKKANKSSSEDYAHCYVRERGAQNWADKSGKTFLKEVLFTDWKTLKPRSPVGRKTNEPRNGLHDAAEHVVAQAQNPSSKM